MVDTYGKSINQPGNVANSARGQLNRENEHFPVPVKSENLVSRDGFGRLVPRTPAHSPRSDQIWCLLKGYPSIFAAASTDLYRHNTSSAQPRVYRVTQLRAEGVLCRVSAGTGRVVLNVIPVTGTAFARHHRPNNARFSFTTSTIGMMCVLIGIMRMYRTFVRPEYP